MLKAKDLRPALIVVKLLWNLVQSTNSEKTILVIGYTITKRHDHQQKFFSYLSSEQACII